MGRWDGVRAGMPDRRLQSQVEAQGTNRCCVLNRGMVSIPEPTGAAPKDGLMTNCLGMRVLRPWGLCSPVDWSIRTTMANSSVDVTATSTGTSARKTGVLASTGNWATGGDMILSFVAKVLITGILKKFLGPP